MNKSYFGGYMFGQVIHKGEEAYELFEILDRVDRGDNVLKNYNELQNIQKVDFSGMNIIEVPKSIGLLCNIEELELQFNKITILPESIGSLSKLKCLDLHNNRIKDIPNKMCNLLELKTLNFDWNDIDELPEQFSNLKKLNTLSMIGNQLHTLPPTFGDLVSLKTLDIQSNHILSLPYSMRKLRMLETFDMSENPITYFPEFLCVLGSLKRLGIGKMKFHHFPREILDLNLPFKQNTLFDISNPKGIYIFGTILATQPISLFLQDRSMIEAYFESPKTTLQEAKVIFLGDGSVGKTYTIKRLLRKGMLENSSNAKEFVTNETHGIIISEYKPIVNKIRIKFWDFGGQDILHSMHRCFLTERSCYVVMVSTRTPDPMGRAQYWLRCIQNFAPESPVILVINRFSHFGCTGLDEAKLKEEFPKLYKIRYFSIKTSSRDEFMLLEKDIIEVCSELDGTGMEVPCKWELIRQNLIEEAEINKKFYISNLDYFAICEKHGMTEINSVTPYGDLRIWLLDWFNDLGNCFSNHKSGRSDFAVLNSEWITNALYLIIYSGKAYTDSGILSHKLIQMILKHPDDGESGNVPYLKDVVYGEKECEYILDIMRDFQISFLENDNNEFIPALSPDARPADLELIPKEWNERNSIHNLISYRLKYRYLPDVILYRLMILCRNVLKWSLSCWWRGGMRIDNVPFKLTIVVEIEPNDELRMDVYAYGMEPAWKLLQPVKQLVLDINERMNLQTEEFIEVQGTKQKDIFKVEWLIKQKNKGKFEVAGEDDDYNIDELLGIAFGTENLETALTDAKDCNIPLEITGLNQAVKNVEAIQYNYYINAYNLGSGNIELDLNNYLQSGFSQKELLEYLQLLPKRESQVPEKFLDELATLLHIQAKEYTEFQKVAFERLADQLGEKGTPKKRRLEKLRDWVGDAANIVTLTPVVVCNFPSLCNFLQKKIPELIQNFSTMVQILKFIG